jgi:Domain of Unknown Function with PDB structure (DUF3857)/Transglutaminase-like superfamily
MVSAGASTKITFVAPTPEELSMTSVPGHPGLPAVVLNREEVTQDEYGRILHYNRIKVLTEDGRDYANVALSFVHGKDNRKVTDITGRTIQPDGTIVVFSGQPYEKVLEKRKGAKLQQTVFTLPDVRVGSILEYSYIEQFSHFVDPPTWDVQGDLFVLREHFVWNPTHAVRGEHNMLTKVAYYDILPEGVKVQTEKKSYTGVFDLGGRKLETYEVTATDVPPTPDESDTPPMSSLRYSVRFAYVHSEEDRFWTEEGKYWSKSVDHFMPSNDHLDAVTKQLTAGAATEEEKLRRIYAAVMALENTEFTRDHPKSENEANDHAKVKEANDVLELKEGTPSGLTILFLAMARSAGMEAFAMYVPDRTEAVFVPQWLSFDQFSDLLAVVKVDGKEHIFDPGSRYCPFGKLAWWHEQVQGLRQSANGTVLERTPAGALNNNVTRRHAELRLDAEGNASGAVDVSYTGAAALHWRRDALRGDDQGFRHSLQESLQELLPPGLVIEIAAVDHVQEYEEPLIVHASVSGRLATAAGKRWLLPVDVFSARETSPLAENQRVYPLDFRYPERVDDTVDVKLPRQMTIEAPVAPADFSVRSDGSYKMSVTSADGGFIAHREFVFEGVLMPASEYNDLHGFFAKIGTEDREQVVLTTAH